VGHFRFGYLLLARAREFEQAGLRAAPFHPRLRGVSAGLPLIWDEQTTLQTDAGEIDLLAEVAGLGDFAEVKRHSILVDAFDRTIATLTLPALVRAKLSTGREKDRSAVPELQSLLEAAGE
jgi:hypothetical protein